MWELDYKESWAPKNRSFRTVVLEKTLQSSLDCKEFKPVHPKGNQSRIFTVRTDAETPICWPPDAKSWLIWKAPDAGKEWGQEKKGMRWLPGGGHDNPLQHSFLENPHGQRSLVGCSPQGRKESDKTKWLSTVHMFKELLGNYCSILNRFTRHLWYILKY